MPDPARIPVACIGAGLIGRAWAIVFARAGHPVRVHDPTPGAAAAAVTFAGAMLPALAAVDLLNGADPAEVLGRIAAAPTLEAALEGALHVQESAPEDLATKRALFARLDAAAEPAAVLSSSAATLPPSAFTEGLPGRARCLVVQPVNPPYLVRAAEVAPAPWTAVEALARTMDLLRAAGMAPTIATRRGIGGCVAIRLQGALLDEAFRMTADGETGDGVRESGWLAGLTPGWGVTGPIATIDLNGAGSLRAYVDRLQRWSSA